MNTRKLINFMTNFNNPELKWHLSSECSRQRLIALPIILGLMFFFGYQVSHKLSTVVKLSQYTTLFFIYCWGIKRASEALKEAIVNHTWHNESMMTSSPLHFSVGKLFGITSYTWYGAFICIATHLTFSPHKMAFAQQLVIILGGLFGQALAFLLTLKAIKLKNKAILKDISSEKYYIIALLTSVIITGLIYSALNFKSPTALQGTVTWYTIQCNPLFFYLVMQAIVVIWTFVGIYRLMRLEFQYANKPHVLIVFCLFSIIYITGFFI